MSTFAECALARKPLRLVRRQAHLGDDDSRYEPVSILEDEDSSTSEGGGGGGGGRRRASAALDPRPRLQRRREAPLRHMSLFDLVAFGVGCTIGGGVFVLGGAAAHSWAGPASSVSYLLSGLAVGLAALPYAELSASFPVDGSTYSYAYIALGEVYAVIASMCQTLEYGVSAAAVARSWGNKVVDLVKRWGDPLPNGLLRFLEPGYYVSPMAAIVASLCTLVLLLGVRESKLATNCISSMKVSLIVFMIVAGMILSSGLFPGTKASFENWDPFVPSEFGVEGVLEASSLLIFAYTGFDCICNQAGEAKDPVRDVPRAVVYTIVIDSVLYVLAALTLTAMLPYAEISEVSGFPDAFSANGWAWAEKMTAIGEILVLPLVVLASIQAQTRLLFAMSNDRIVPRFFGQLTFSEARRCRREDKIGNLTANVQFCGLVTIFMATFIPFQFLVELVAAGALLLFSMTSCCMLIVRYKCPSESFLGSVRDVSDDATIFSVEAVRRELSLGRILILLNLFPLASGLCFAFIPINALRYSLTGTFAFLTVVVAVFIAAYCHENTSTRFILNRDGYGTPGRIRFRTPCVPFSPALGIYLNWFMLANLGWKGIVMLIGYLFVGVVLYWKCCVGKSIVNSNEPHEENESYKNRNILPSERCTSPLRSDLQQTLLGEEDWEEGEHETGLLNNVYLKDELSEIETSRRAVS